MELIKIHSTSDNIYGYHAVFLHSNGRVTTQRADYMALATLKDSDGYESEEMLPMVHSSEGYLYVCHSGLRNYVGIAKPGTDALFIAAVSARAGDAYDAWIEREGITELLVPYGRN